MTVSTKTDSAPKVDVYALLFVSGPVLWFAHFALIYVLVDFGCQAGIGQSRIAGQDALKVLIVFATVVAALLTAISAFVSLRHWRRTGPEEADRGRAENRRHFTGLISFLSNLLFTVVIIVTAVPVFFLSSCGGMGV